MIGRIKQLAKKIGIDGAVFYTLLARVLQAVGGVISIVFIAKYLTTIEQGYYYTFASILAIQIFFELGLSNIITQFVAHEKAFLYWDGRVNLSGDAKSLSRLSSLLRFCIKWFLVLAMILFFALLIVGFIFFEKYGKQDTNVEWQIPWLILSILTACNLITSPILAFVEGLGEVQEVAKIRLLQQVVQLIAIFLFLIMGLKLYSSPLSAILTTLIPPVYIYSSYIKNLLINIWNGIGDWKVNYRVEIFPYQWRIALSWLSGYFIFQLFNPVIFATEGAKEAGQMGMTLAALNGVLSISLSWINTKVPLFSSLIAKKEYKMLDSIFNRTIFQASMICLACLCVMIFTIYGLQYYQYSIGSRFLPITCIILLSAAAFVNQLVSALATYLRCHKEEPFLILSIVIGLFTACSTLILGNYYGVKGIVGGYSFLTIIVSLSWAYYIFKIKKKEWHK